MKKKKIKPIWLMQPVPYFGEDIQGTWIIEEKIDGWRMQIIKDNGIFFYGRRLKKNPNWSKKLKFLAKYLDNIPEGTLLDAELATNKGRGFIPSLFAQSNKEVKPIIYVFDIVYMSYINISKYPLIVRKQALRSLALKKPFREIEYEILLHSENIYEIMDRYVKKNAEGIVLKYGTSKYLIGKQSPYCTEYWKKLKPSYKKPTEAK